MSIKKAVFPVAGLGTRFLPVTKACSKEMLPVVDKPLIQYAVEEAARAGMTHMIVVTSASKRAIEDHFDPHYEWEESLKSQGKDHLLTLIRDICPPGVEFTYIRQSEPLGLGHAVLCAESVVGNEPFAVLLADDLVDDHNVPCFSALIEHFMRDGHSIVGVRPVSINEIHRYGVVSVMDKTQNYSSILAMIEKPSREMAPSNLAAFGRYLFTPTIFSCLRQTARDSEGEIQLTSAIQQLLTQEIVKAYQFHGKHYDCGSKLGYLKATIELGMQHGEVGQDFRDYLKTIFSSEE